MPRVGTQSSRIVPMAGCQEIGDLSRIGARLGGEILIAYLLDADVFIRAENLRYGLDLCPASWGWLIAQNVAGHVFSREKAGDEVSAGTDELGGWAQARGAGFFRRLEPTAFPALAVVSAWANGQHYDAAAVSALRRRLTTTSLLRCRLAGTRSLRAKTPRPPRARSRSRTRVSALALRA